MIIRLTFEVTFPGGDPFEVTTNARDYVEFERQFDTSMADFRAEMRSEWLLFLAHKATARAGRHGGTLDEFLDVVEECNLVRRDAAVPTPAAP